MATVNAPAMLVEASQELASCSGRSPHDAKIQHGGDAAMGAYWFWILLILFAVMLAGFPAWPYSRGWGYGPSLGALVVIIVIAGMMWLGFLAIWWPWTGTVQYY